MAVDSLKKCERQITVRQTEGGSEIPLRGDYDFTFIRDISCTYRFAQLTLRDMGGGMRELLPLTGNEIFHVSLRNQSSDSESIEVDFEANKIREEPLESFTASDRGITVYLVEYPLFRILSDKKSRGWEEATVKEIVEDILIEIKETDYSLNVRAANTFIEKFIQPSTWSNLKTIKFLSRRTEGGPHHLFPSSFYDNEKGAYRNKINFISNKKMVTSTPTRTIRMISDSDLQNSSKTSPDIITDFQPEIASKNDLLSDMTTTNVAYYNYDEGLFETETYSYKDFLEDKSITKLGKKAPFNLSIQDSIVSNKVCGNEFINEDDEPVDIQRRLTNGFKKNFQKQLVLNLLCIGNEQRSVGEKVTLIFPSSDKDPSEILDKGLSGEWIIRRIESMTGPDNSYSDYIVAERNAYFDNLKDDLPEV